MFLYIKSTVSYLYRTSANIGQVKYLIEFAQKFLMLILLCQNFGTYESMKFVTVYCMSDMVHLDSLLLKSRHWM